MQKSCNFCVVALHRAPECSVAIAAAQTRVRCLLPPNTNKSGQQKLCMMRHTSPGSHGQVRIAVHQQLDAVKVTEICGGVKRGAATAGCIRFRSSKCVKGREKGVITGFRWLLNPLHTSAADCRLQSDRWRKRSGAGCSLDCD